MDSAAAAGGGEASEPPSPLAQSPGVAEQLGQQAQQQPQQQRQQGGKHARQAGGPAAGPSISSLFERAHKRQRASTPEAQGRQQREQDAQQQQAGLGTAAGQGVQVEQEHATEAHVQSAVRRGEATLPPDSTAQAGGHEELEAVPAEERRCEAPEADVHAGVEDADVAALAGVDVEEQRRILKDLEMLQRLNRSRPSSAGGGGSVGGSAKAGRPGTGGKPGSRQQSKSTGNQPGILGFFSKPGS